MDNQVASPRLFLTAERVARRYLNIGYGIILGGSAVAGAIGVGFTSASFSGPALGWVVAALVILCLVLGGLLAATGHQMKAGRWGLRIDDETLTVLNGWRRTDIPWRDLEYYAIRPWGRARELQVRFRPGTLPPRGFSSGRPAGPGRRATDLTPLYQVSMLGARESDCLAELARHLPRQA